MVSAEQSWMLSREKGMVIHSSRRTTGMSVEFSRIKTLPVHQDGPDGDSLGYEEPQRGHPYAGRRSLDQCTGILFGGKC